MCAQGYAGKLEAEVPAVRHDVSRDAPTADIDLVTARTLCALVATAAFMLDNVPQLARFIATRAAAPPAARTAGPPDDSGAGSPCSSESGTFSDGAASDGAFAQVTSAFERLTAAALRAIDAGLLAQVGKYIDGPMLAGGGLTVMAANLGAWRLEQACSPCTLVFAAGLAHLRSQYMDVCLEHCVCRSA